MDVRKGQVFTWGVIFICTGSLKLGCLTDGGTATTRKSPAISYWNLLRFRLHSQSNTAAVCLSSFNLLTCNSIVPQIMFIVFVISHSHSCSPSEEMHFCLAYSHDFLFCEDSIRVNIKHRLDYCYSFSNLCFINFLVTCISHLNTMTEICSSYTA